MKTKVQIEIDLDLNNEIKNDLFKKRKLKKTNLIKEKFLGEMIEERYVLEILLNFKGITFSQLMDELRFK
jgi:hypothetical protein